MKWNAVLVILMGQYCVIFCQLYEYIRENKTWNEAQEFCREKHTDLVTVTNMTDMERLLSNSPGGMKEAWIGLYDQTHGIRKWYWSLPGVEFNESELTWAPNEPNDANGPQNCGLIWKTLKWGDINCDAPHYFVCYDESKSSKKFYLIQEKKTWTAAQSYCRETHTDLVSGLTQIQDEELKRECSSVQDGDYILAGLFRDTWRWSDGSSFSFRHWNLQFNHQKINTGKCAMTDDEGRWKNEDCTVRKPFICYDDKVILIKENKTWEDALNYCRDHHHDLVTITNMDEQRSVQQKAQFASTPFVWMGLHYACTLDLWFWISDEVVSYKNWASDGRMDDCDMSGAMETGGRHQWFKRNDTDMFNFICFKNRQNE